VDQHWLYLNHHIPVVGRDHPNRPVLTGVVLAGNEKFLAIKKFLEGRGSTLKTRIKPIWKKIQRHLHTAVL
jgi:hypothetical protein